VKRAAPGSVALVVAVVALVGGAVLVEVAQARFGGDLRSFLFLGARFSHPEVLRHVPPVGEWGYDGQFYAALATDPLLLRRSTPRVLDDPSYRAGRVALPLAAWLLALGHPGAAIWCYLFLCWTGTLALVAVVAWWLEGHGLSPWWATLLAASGGTVTAVFRSTPDGAAVSLALLALVAKERRPPAVAASLFCLAVLTRETMFLAALAAAGAEARERHWRRAVLYAALPAASFLAWRAVVAWRLSGPLLSGGGNLGAPLGWLPGKAEALASGRLGLLGVEVWGMLGVGVALVAGFLLLRTRPEGALELSFLLFAGLALLLSQSVYADAYAYTRILLPVPALALMVAVRAGPWLRRWLVATAAASAVVGVVMAMIEVGAAFSLLSALRRRLLG
jgi:hypothetical protein